VARGQQEGRTVGRLILLNGEIGKTTGIKDSVESSPWVRKREDLSDDRMMQKSGVKFTAQQDMIWKCKTFLDHKKMPPPAPLAPQEPRRGNHRRENSDDDEHMAEISMIFRGSMSITSKTQGNKLQWEISLAQRIEPGRRMRWSDVDISFGPEDHPITELSDRNLPFVVKIPIGRHRMAKTMIDSGASLNLLMRRTFIEMGLSLADLTSVQDTFHGIILGQSSIPIGRIDLEVSYGSGENKRRETLTFEVASFDISYNCILGRPFLLKFMAIIHTAYATIKMPGPKGVITLRSDHRDAVACENATLTHAGKFGNKEAQDLAVKMAKIQQGNTPSRIVTPGSAVGGTSRPATLTKGITMASPSNQPAANQLAAEDKKGATDKEVAVDPNNADKKLRISTELDPK
jgi:hypothetical protein